MLRSQRLLIVVALLLVAWLLHFNLCDWISKDALADNEYRSLVVWRHDMRNYAQPTYIVRSGIVTERGVNVTEGIVLGIAVPILLTVSAICLILGWRVSERRKRGLCVECGYDLRGGRGGADAGPLAKCPECGTPVAAGG